MVQQVQSEEDSDISLDDAYGGDTPKGIPAADDIIQLIERNSEEASKRSLAQKKPTGAVVITDSDEHYGDEFTKNNGASKRSAGYFVQ